MNEIISFTFLFGLMAAMAKYQSDVNTRHDGRLDVLDKSTAVDRHMLLERFETFEEKLNGAKVDKAVMIDSYESRFSGIEKAMERVVDSLHELSDLIRDKQ